MKYVVYFRRTDQVSEDSWERFNKVLEVSESTTVKEIAEKVSNAMKGATDADTPFHVTLMTVA
jgi:hypothetical protein